jgi:acyl-CoA thioesterase-1
MMGWFMRMKKVDWVPRRQALLALSLGHCSLGWFLALSARASLAATRHRILVLGDSLSAEYGLTRGSGWVALLSEQLAKESSQVEVINASISGETTVGGQTRLPALLKQHQPRIVVLELGANDALRGLPLDKSRAQLIDMCRVAKLAGAKVLLVGMHLPPNYGARYGREFADLYRSVAREEHVALVPFMLAGVADQVDTEAWFQADRIHPLAKAHPIILSNIWPVLRPLLR